MVPHRTHEERQASLEARREQDNNLLQHKIGYQPQLRRTFSTFETFGLAFAIMGLMPSISSTLVYGLPAGPAGLVWGWVIALTFITIIAISVGELASAMPTSGGLYFWTHFYAHPSIRNPLSFFVGYANTLGNLAGLISTEYGAAVMVSSVISIGNDGAWSATTPQLYGITVAILVSHALICSVGNRWLAKMQTLYVIGNVLMVIVTCIGLPLSLPSHRRNSAKWVFTHVENLSSWPAGFTFILSFLVPVWTVNGFDSAVHISEEATDAAKAVPRALLSVCISCLVLGWCCIIAICFSMNPDVAAIYGTPLGQPMAQIYLDAFGKKSTLAIWSCMLVLQWTMGSSLVISASRQVWAFSRDGALPLSRYIKRVGRNQVPVFAVWTSAFLAGLMGLLVLINAAASSALFSLLVAGCYTAYCVPVFSRLAWGNAKFAPGPFHTGVWSKPIAVTAILFEVFMFLVFLFPVGGPDPSADEMNYASAIYGFVILITIVYWYLPVIGAKKWFTGPKTHHNPTQVAVEEITAVTPSEQSLYHQPDSAKGFRYEGEV
ncbi:hypothetical protein A1O3_01698 [Capronia epimyces CBS 606.96]|uniref:Amino acid permease n=1 Tax=Capronia epimyces CBS 606.96 TaxID=1182542 RepID=W9YV47_9EURO|nr:uncharacterized protein A1O3_01698 [Capronia epimyces CBS 606.96]EXJ93141.1 hypothetical protein A1O3_01698 [Capronia epimyces CBS 606.96]